MVARRAAAADVLAGRGGLGAQRLDARRLDQRRRDRAHAPPGARRRPDRAGRQRVRAQRVRRPRRAGGAAGPRGRARPGAPLPQPAAGPDAAAARVLPARGVRAGGGVAAGAGPDGAARPTAAAAEPPASRVRVGGGRRRPRRLPAWRAYGPGRPPTPLRRPCSASGSGSPSAGGCASCPTATSPAASSAPSGGPGCRWRTRTASARTRGCPGSVPRPPGRPARPSTWRSGSPRRRARGLASALDAALPDGLDVLAAAVAERRAAGRPDRREPVAHRAARRRARRPARGARRPAGARVRGGRAGDAVGAAADRRAAPHSSARQVIAV